MTDSRRVFEVADLATIDRALPGRIASRRVLPNIDVHIPPIVYGQVEPPDFEFWEYPPRNWFEKAYALHDASVFTLRDATVHGELGIITIDRFLVQESLYLALPEVNGLTWVDANHLRVPDPPPELHLERALHAMCGYVGNRNYAHWWVDIVPVIGFAIENGILADTKLLLPPLPARYQAQTLALIPEIEGRSIVFEPQTHARCAELLFHPRLTASDYTPDPGRMRFMAQLKRRAGAREDVRRKLYLSRRDAAGRPLANADAVEAAAAEFGYEIVMTSGLSVAEQIRLFAEASHLISPHGAGLANMLFCRPSTRLLELHYDRCINWSLRRLAAVIPMSYGCLVGRQEPGRPEQTEDEGKNNPWTIEIGEFRAAAQSMA